MSEAVAEKKASDPLIVGRYALFDELAAGGMATVHLARLLTNDGPGRTVAVKRLHAQYTRDNEFCAMFMDEARLVTRIKHPNCVRTVDVVQDDEGLFLVMEYVHGESLSRLMRTTRERKEPIAPKLIATIVHNALLGLHAAHDVTDDDGKPLNVVHRDVSPQNIIVGVDGVARVLDFGIAKAAGRMQTTREGQIKGKLAYMAPEQIRGQVDRRTDVFAAAVCLWEALASRRLHEGLKDVEIVTRVVQGKFVPPSSHASGISPELDQIVLKGLAADPKKRYLTAKDMAADIESKVGLMERAEITRWVEMLAKPTLDKRAAKAAAMEQAAKGLRPSASALRMPALSTPDAFLPVSAIEPTNGARSEEDVRAELDAVAPTMPPPNGGGLRTATPVVPIAPVRPLAPPPPQDVPSVSAPLAAPLPSIVTTPPGPSDTTHTQLTPSGTEVPFGVAEPHAQRPQRSPAVYMLLGAALLLALAGAALGGYAVARRAPAPEPVPNVTPTNPNVTTPPVPSPPTTPEIAPAPPANGSATESESTTATPTTTASASAAPAVSAKPKPVAKPASAPCDPPFTVDENGNKKFKPECMGL